MRARANLGSLPGILTPRRHFKLSMRFAVKARKKPLTAEIAEKINEFAEKGSLQLGFSANSAISAVKGF